MAKKDEYRIKILEYLSNPENDWPTRTAIATEICKYADTSGLYRVLPSSELTLIEQEGLNLRLKRMGGQVLQVVKVLHKKAIKGDVLAAKEYLKRTMGDKSVADLNLNIPDGLEVRFIMPRPELQENNKS